MDSLDADRAWDEAAGKWIPLEELEAEFSRE
jgi:hypothetical protein